MKVCSNCFNDEEVKNFILTSSSDISQCDCCNNNDCVIELRELYDFFVEFIGLFSEDENCPMSLSETLNTHWGLFSSEECAQLILNELYASGIINLKPDDKVRYVNEILECTTVWDKLKQDVTTKSRFFTDVSTFQWDSFIQPNFTLKEEYASIPSSDFTRRHQ